MDSQRLNEKYYSFHEYWCVVPQIEEKAKGCVKSIYHKMQAYKRFHSKTCNKVTNFTTYMV